MSDAPRKISFYRGFLAEPQSLGWVAGGTGLSLRLHTHDRPESSPPSTMLGHLAEDWRAEEALTYGPRFPLAEPPRVVDLKHRRASQARKDRDETT